MVSYGRMRRTHRQVHRALKGVSLPFDMGTDQKANEFRLYYGAADSSVGLALADPEELIEYMKSCPTAG
jgi:hypothetical protein